MRRPNQVRRAIQCALEGMLSGNHVTGGNPTHYGLRVPSFSDNLRHIDLAFGFLEGHGYCCTELGCHVPHWSAVWWRQLRKDVARQGVELPPSRVTIHVAVFTDPGAQFSVFGPATSFSMYESTWCEPRRRHE